jgi:hypothetical protein
LPIIDTLEKKMINDSQVFAYIENGDVRKAFAGIVKNVGEAVVKVIDTQENSIKKPGIARASDLSACLLTMAAHLQKEGHRLIAVYAEHLSPGIKEDEK